ncbi:MAG: hypothetical protein ACFFBP_19910 [Promethearchaeota archaeon]
MVKIVLNLLNIFQLRTQQKSIEYDGDTVGDIIKQFVKEFRDKLDPGLLDKKKKKLNKGMLILLNGRNIEFLDKYKTKLKVEDKLYVSVPLGGG